MAQSQEILNDVSASKFQGIHPKIKEFLKPALDKERHSKQQQLQYYKQFVLRFLHSVVSLKKPPTDKDSIEEILQSSILCCDVALTVQREAGIDSQYTVPRLIYHILLKCTCKGQDHLENVYRLSEQLFEMLQAGGQDIPDDATKIIFAVYAVLWNSAVKLIPKNLTVSGKLQCKILKQLGICLKFLSVLPNYSLLVEKIQDIVIKHVEWKTLRQKAVSPVGTPEHAQKDSRSAVTLKQCDILLSVFDQVIARLVELCNTSTDNQQQCMHRRRILCQVRCVVTEWFIKMRMYSQAECMIQDVQQSAHEKMKSVCITVVRMFSFNIETDKAIHSKVGKCFEKSVETLPAVNTMVDTSNLDDDIDLWLVHRVYHNLMHQVDKQFFDKFNSQLTPKTVQTLIASCDMFTSLCTKTIEQMENEGNSAEGKSGSDTDLEKDSKKKLDYITKLNVWRISSHFKQLEILSSFLQEHYDEGAQTDIMDQLTETATKYQDMLLKHSLALSEKSLQSERYNIGYFCYKLGKLLYSKDNYTYAGPLLKIAGHHFHLCNSPKAIRLYELSVDSYRYQHSWIEATKVLVSALDIGSKVVPSAVGWWSKVKRDAVAKEEEFFTEMTFNCVVEQSDVEVKEYSKRDLLILEYLEWTKFSERNFEVEYKLLTEMLDKSTNTQHKAEVMVELAVNIFLTGKTYDNRSSGELLSKAIIMLDKSKEDVQSVLALAHYRKFVVSHEETVETLIEISKLDKDNENEETSKDTSKSTKQSTDKPSTKYDTRCTLETEQCNLPYLVRAILLWESAFNGGSKCKPGQGDKGVKLFDLGIHVDTMMTCGTRLISMRQSDLALRVLHVACSQLKNTSDNKQTLTLKIKTAHALVILGRLSEAEEMINTLETDEETLEKLLLLAQLCLHTGKKEEGMALLFKVLNARKPGNLTPKMCLMNGTAKRLLSMFLCLPGAHKLCPFGVDPLSLASEAVKLHMTVLTLESKKGACSNSLDKWLLIFEFLQTLLHLCQLLCYKGLPVKAEFYLKEGFKLSQAHGLPRWSCEFMFETLRTQSMLVNEQRSVAAVYSIRKILDESSLSSEDVTDHCEVNKKLSKHSGKCVNMEMSSVPELIDQSEETESVEREVSFQLDDNQRKQMSKLTIPECKCLRDKDPANCDIDIHRLYVKAGIILSDFLSQYEMEPDAYRVLSELQSKYPHYLNCFEHNKTLERCDGHTTQPENTVASLFSAEHIDPHVKFLNLEAVCLQVESLLYQKKFDEVQDFWVTLKDWESQGFLDNVLYSDILMTRVALCQASSFMFSVQSTADKIVKNQLTQSSSTSELISFNDMQENSSIKKVLFADTSSDNIERAGNKQVGVDLEVVGHNESLIAPLTKSLKKTKSALTPFKSKSLQENKEQFNNLMLSAQKQKPSFVFGTPLTGRKAKLDFLMETEDDDIIFPVMKAVTPKSVRSEKGKRVRTRRGKTSIDKTSPADNKHESSATTLDQPSQDETKIEKTKTTVKTMKGNRKINNKTETVDKRSRRKNTVDEMVETEGDTGTETKIETDSSFKQSDDQENIVHSKVTKDVFDFKSPNDTKTKTELSQGTSKFVNSDDDDDDIVEFPVQKPVTPAVRKRCMRSRKGKEGRALKNIPVSNLNNSAHKNESTTVSTITPDNEKLSTDKGDIESLQNSEMARNNKLSLKKKKNHLKDPSKGLFRRNSSIDDVEKDQNKENECLQRNDVKEIESKEESQKPVSSILELKGDVFDFDCSPAPKETGKKKGRVTTKKVGKTEKKVSDPPDKRKKKPSPEDKKVTKVDSKKAGKSITRSRRNLRNDIESARTIKESLIDGHGINLVEDRFDYLNCSIELDNMESNIDLSITELHDIEFEGWHSPVVTFASHSQTISIIQEDNTIRLNNDFDLDPIEIMRGGARPRGRGKANKAACKSDQSEESKKDEQDCKQPELRDMEVVRSSGSVSMKDLMDRLSLECSVDVSADTGTAANESSLLMEEKVLELLEDLCGRISHFAPYPQYPKMCQILAQKYVYTNPQKAAFLLSESIAVSFRHQAAIIRGKTKCRSAQSTLMSRDAAISDMFPDPDNQFRDKDESNLQTLIDVILPDWCVVQVSVISDLLQCQHFVLTRFVRGRSPVVIEVPAFSTPQGRYVLKDFEKLHDRNISLVELTDKADWWRQRTELDTDLQGIIENIEKFWIGPWKALFLPPIDDDKLVLSTKKEIKKVVKLDIDVSKLEVLLLSKGILSDPQLQACVKGLLGSQCKDADIDAIISIVKKSSLPDKQSTSQHHVVLILDKNVQHLPWECVPSLCERSVSRMPCLSHLYYQLSYLSKQENSVFNKGVNPKNTYYILNPDGDLPHTESQFKEWFDSEDGWKGVCGTKPTKEQFNEALTDRDLLLYLGHGSGARYFPSMEIEKLQARAVALLMGCSSGKLHVKGQLEPMGIMTSYFLADCPCMVANLWDVTDKDIDKYTAELLKSWWSAEDGLDLIPYVQKARKVCKMKYLVGSAPVVYGLPVFLKRNSEN